jgi:hypothetical protein
MTRYRTSMNPGTDSRVKAYFGVVGFFYDPFGAKELGTAGYNFEPEAEISK